MVEEGWYSNYDLYPNFAFLHSASDSDGLTKGTYYGAELAIFPVRSQTNSIVRKHILYDHLALAVQDDNVENWGNEYGPGLVLESQL
jgi:hypothetical protein